MTPTIYRIEFPDGQAYIGATRNFAERRRQHLKSARRGDAVNARLRAAFAKHAECAISPIASGFSVAALHELETQLIEQEQPALNVNLTAVRLTEVPQSAIRIDGRTIGEWAARTGLKPMTIYMRLRKGWSEQEAIGAVPRTPYKPTGANVKKTYIAAGGLNLTLNQWADRLGVKPGVLHARRHAGWSPEEVVGLVERPSEAKAKASAEARSEKEAKRAARQVTHKDFTGTLADACRHFGVSDAMVRSRLKLGWSLAQAIDTPKNNGGPTPMLRA